MVFILIYCSREYLIVINTSCDC